MSQKPPRTSVNDLRSVLQSVVPPTRLVCPASGRPIVDGKPQVAPNNEHELKANMDAFDQDMVAAADEVVPRLFIGNWKGATSTSLLKSKGITHVVNMAHRSTDKFGFYNIKEEDLQGIQYVGLGMDDYGDSIDGSYIENFVKAADAVDRILNESASHAVAVCCYGGLSRSGSAVAAYLMLKRGLSAVDALTAVKSRRDVHPNDEFLKVLAQMYNHFVLGYGREEAVPDDVEHRPTDPNRALIQKLADS